MSTLLRFTMAIVLVLVPTQLAASDGDLSIVAELSGTDDQRGLECGFWKIRWNNAGSDGKPPFGSCLAPVLKVYASLAGASADGITGAEFAIRLGSDDSPDPGYVLIEMPNPTAAVVLGSAFSPPDPTPRGINIGWSQCQPGDGDRLLLETVFVFPAAACGPSLRPPRLSFLGTQHSSPSNQVFRCPLFTLCDGPAWTKVCLGDNVVECPSQGPLGINAMCSTSGSFLINGNGGVGGCDELRKAPASPRVSWTRIKSLYR